jgi:hypothetical protein
VDVGLEICEELENTQEHETSYDLPEKTENATITKVTAVTVK